MYGFPLLAGVEEKGEDPTLSSRFLYRLSDIEFDDLQYIVFSRWFYWISNSEQYC